MFTKSTDEFRVSQIFVPSRRDVVLGSAAAAIFMAPTGRAWSETTFVRPDINSAAGQKMLDLYAKAVAAMQNPAINYPGADVKSGATYLTVESVALNP